MNITLNGIHIYYIVKASYYRLAKVYHPDRVDESVRAAANEKFAALHLAYSVLADPEKKKAYDAGDSTILVAKTTIAAKWEKFIRIIDSADVESASGRYQGSDEEQNDVIREFINGRGSMTHLYNNIPFMRIEDEPRLIELVKKCMKENKIPKMVIRKMKK